MGRGVTPCLHSTISIFCCMDILTICSGIFCTLSTKLVYHWCSVSVEAPDFPLAIIVLHLPNIDLLMDSIIKAMFNWLLLMNLSQRSHQSKIVNTPVPTPYLCALCSWLIMLRFLLFYWQLVLWSNQWTSRCQHMFVNCKEDKKCYIYFLKKMLNLVFIIKFRIIKN